MATTLTTLQTRKSALGETRLVERPLDPALQPGEALLKIDRFALTTNNITYAALGDAQLKYWSHFPTGDAGWGHMPVWGFADVVASSVDGVSEGERFYGYFPIASHVRMQPVRVSGRGFYDGVAHRQELVSAYNQYGRCSQDPAWSPALEDVQVLLRPLFLTSFMLADLLEDQRWFGATTLLFSSASSKTAFGTAHCLRGRAGIDLIGLTSPRNRAFVESLGCYGRTLAYDEVTSLPTDAPTAYVDFSGDDALRATIHHHFGASLVYDCLAGLAQNQNLAPPAQLPGPAPRFFFAPDQIRKRNTDWGPEGFNQRFNAEQARFFDLVSAPGNPWMAVRETRGFEATQRLIGDLGAGRVDPHLGHVVRLP